LNNYISLKKSNCKNCYKCIRHCPVKSIRFSDNQAFIVADECILCGECFVVCPQNAKEIRNDIEKVKSLIKSDKVVIASIAPSFVANYEDVTIASMQKALKQLGFMGAEETAIGATIVKKSYEDMIRQNNNSVIISSCCHSINTLIQKHYPEALPYLANVKSPMQVHCDKIKAENPGVYTVFIGPCISKKEEAEQYSQNVDAVLTFEELTSWLGDEGVTIEKSEDINDSSRARLFPTTGGILRTMDCTQEGYSYISVDGVDNCINAIKDITGGNITNCFVEMSACVGSCIGGPAMDKTHKSPLHDRIAIDNYAGKNDFEIDDLSKYDIKKNIDFIGLHRQMPGSKAIEEILKKMGKQSVDDELNCGSCGYNTCRDKAVAVYLGKADLTMCLPYLKEKAESFSDNIIKHTPNGIIVFNENLEVQQINSAALKIINIDNPNNVIGNPVVRILEPQIYLQVLSTEKNIYNRRVYLAEYKRYVEETVVYDKSYKLVMSIMRDVTDEEKLLQKKEKVSKNTIEIADKVIDKQMRIVQEIASLLGETTAETQIALTNLKRTLNDE